MRAAGTHLSLEEIGYKEKPRLNTHPSVIKRGFILFYLEKLTWEK